MLSISAAQQRKPLIINVFVFTILFLSRYIYNKNKFLFINSDVRNANAIALDCSMLMARCAAELAAQL